jgi:DNA mismatch repair protein MutL
MPRGTDIPVGQLGTPRGTDIPVGQPGTPRGTDIPVGQPGTPRGTDIPVGQLGDGGDRQLWQLHHKYIIAPVEGGVMVVDQHAAHERILYEKTIAGFTNHHTQSQQLLFPISVELTPADAALVGQLRGQLEEIGFTLKFFGASTVIVDGVPVDVRPGEEGRILQNVVDLYKRDEADLQLEPRERLAKSYSCRAAIKKGDPLTVPEMRGLLDGLMKTEIPYVCPHGRPVIVTLSLSELDRRFGRTS